MLAPALQLRHLQHKSIKCRQKRTEKVILVGSIISIINFASLINTRKSQNKNGHYAIVLNVNSNKFILKMSFYSMLLFITKTRFLIVLTLTKWAWLEKQIFGVATSWDGLKNVSHKDL